MKIYNNTLKCIAVLCGLLFSCGSSNSNGTIISTPVENIDTRPLKYSVLTENEKQNWNHLDLIQDTIPGMSVDKAYDEIVKNKKGKTTIVAVIDSGIDITHEDLDGVIWTNKAEVPNNGKDDDNNGYIDDIHGWNFLGDTYYEQMEYTRLLASGDTSNPRYAEAQKEYNEAVQKYTTYKTQYGQLITEIKAADKAVATHLGKANYTKEDVSNIKTENESLARSVSIIKYVYTLDFDNVQTALVDLGAQLEDLNNWLDYRLNKSFKGRKTGDNVNDITDTKYGNNNVMPMKEGEVHGTFVAGIIAAERKNNRGIKGVANNVLIMPLRVVSDADEYDKDVALAIRYAVDNGAKIINGSFGKYYSPHPEWVQDAIKYAASKNVLFVHASGNESLDIDTKTNFPNDDLNATTEISDNFLSIGALNSKYGSGLVADYSNYGRKNVDIFAPGSQIYSTEPGNKYDYADGTSFASPNAAGVAALVWSQYPNLTASQVKSILINSGVDLTNKVSVGGDPNNVKSFNTISKSGKIVNAYNALIMAQQMSAQ
ncbi:Subtilase family protein [Flavobacteriaceae bacterium MAR_2010_188]|nr:Subtilase family protein [Flavobacteriaceae bacterium MAR_2010_188]